MNVGAKSCDISVGNGGRMEVDVRLTQDSERRSSLMDVSEEAAPPDAIPMVAAVVDGRASDDGTGTGNDDDVANAVMPSSGVDTDFALCDQNGRHGSVSSGTGNSDRHTGSGHANNNNNRKKHRRKHKGGQRHWKPYTKMTWEEKKELEDRETRRACKKREQRFASGQPMAPYNTTQFLMEQHQPDTDIDAQQPTRLNRSADGSSNTTGNALPAEPVDNNPTSASSANLGGPGANGSGSGGDLGSSGGDEEYYSSPDDEEIFMEREFTEAYENYHAERLQTMSKDDLVREYLELESKVDALERRSKEKQQQQQLNGGSTNSSLLLSSSSRPTSPTLTKLHSASSLPNINIVTSSSSAKTTAAPDNNADSSATPASAANNVPVVVSSTADDDQQKESTTSSSKSLAALQAEIERLRADNESLQRENAQLRQGAHTTAASLQGEP